MARTIHWTAQIKKATHTVPEHWLWALKAHTKIDDKLTGIPLHYFLRSGIVESKGKSTSNFVVYRHIPLSEVPNYISINKAWRYPPPLTTATVMSILGFLPVKWEMVFQYVFKLCSFIGSELAHVYTCFSSCMN